jgi:hypothetical protein
MVKLAAKRTTMIIAAAVSAMAFALNSNNGYDILIIARIEDRIHRR